MTDPDKKWGFISLGTWALAGLERDEPLCNPKIVPLEFGNEGGVFGKSMLLKNLTGMWIIQQCRRWWNSQLEEPVSWDEIVIQARNAKEQNCVIDVDLPKFGQYQSNMPKVVSDYCKETGQDVPETLGEIAMCVYKSLALKVRDSFEGVLSTIGESIDMLHIVGGGTQNHLVCQQIANAMGIPAVAGPTETTAMGNLVFQLYADGRLKSVEEGRKLCAKSSELYRVEPEDKEYWDEAYEHYKTIVQR